MSAITVLNLIINRQTARLLAFACLLHEKSGTRKIFLVSWVTCNIPHDNYDSYLGKRLFDRPIRMNYDKFVFQSLAFHIRHRT